MVWYNHLFYNTGDDIIFNASGLTFSMANGDRMCFSVTVADDNEIDAINSSLTYSYFIDRTRIIVRDNDG